MFKDRWWCMKQEIGFNRQDWLGPWSLASSHPGIYTCNSSFWHQMAALLCLALKIASSAESSETHSFVHSFHKYLLSVYNVLKTFLDSWDTILNAAQEKQKTSCPLGASSLSRKTVSTGETHLECGRAREREQGPRGER